MLSTSVQPLSHKIIQARKKNKNKRDRRKARKKKEAKEREKENGTQEKKDEEERNTGLNNSATRGSTSAAPVSKGINTTNYGPENKQKHRPYHKNRNKAKYIQDVKRKIVSMTSSSTIENFDTHYSADASLTQSMNSLLPDGSDGVDVLETLRTIEGYQNVVYAVSGQTGDTLDGSEAEAVYYAAEQSCYNRAALYPLGALVDRPIWHNIPTAETAHSGLARLVPIMYIDDPAVLYDKTHCFSLQYVGGRWQQVSIREVVELDGTTKPGTVYARDCDMESVYGIEKTRISQETVEVTVSMLLGLKPSDKINSYYKYAKRINARTPVRVYHFVN
jgi:hypothetical protein